MIFDDAEGGRPGRNSGGLCLVMTGGPITALIELLRHIR